MKEHEHHAVGLVVDQLAVLQRQEGDRREHEHEHERRALLRTAAADAESLLRRMNRCEPIEAASAAPEPVEDRPLRHVPDDELDLDTFSGRIEGKRRGLLPARFCQSREDYDTQVAAFKAERYRAITGRQSSARRRCATAARRPARREARLGQHGRRARRHATTSLRDDGDPPGGESDPEPDPWPWLSCADLSAAEAQSAADRIAAACRGFLTPSGLRLDVEAIWPHLRGEARSAAVIAVYVRLPRVLREQHDRAVHANREGGRR
jgi:hypothetical protein